MQSLGEEQSWPAQDAGFEEGSAEHGGMQAGAARAARAKDVPEPMERRVQVETAQLEAEARVVRAAMALKQAEAPLSEQEVDSADEPMLREGKEEAEARVVRAAFVLEEAEKAERHAESQAGLATAAFRLALARLAPEAEALVEAAASATKAFHLAEAKANSEAARADREAKRAEGAEIALAEAEDRAALDAERMETFQHRLAVARLSQQEATARAERAEAALVEARSVQSALEAMISDKDMNGILRACEEARARADIEAKKVLESTARCERESARAAEAEERLAEALDKIKRSSAVKQEAESTLKEALERADREAARADSAQQALAEAEDAAAQEAERIAGYKRQLSAANTAQLAADERACRAEAAAEAAANAAATAASKALAAEAAAGNEEPEASHSGSAVRQMEQARKEALAHAERCAERADAAERALAEAEDRAWREADRTLLFKKQLGLAMKALRDAEQRATTAESALQLNEAPTSQRHQTPDHARWEATSEGAGNEEHTGASAEAPGSSLPGVHAPTFAPAVAEPDGHTPAVEKPPGEQEPHTFPWERPVAGARQQLVRRPNMRPRRAAFVAGNKRLPGGRTVAAGPAFGVLADHGPRQAAHSYGLRPRGRHSIEVVDLDAEQLLAEAGQRPTARPTKRRGDRPTSGEAPVSAKRRVQRPTAAAPPSKRRRVAKRGR